MGYIDIHSHILPKMDDGSKDIQQSIEMLRIAEAEGITHMFATPHYKSGRFSADSKAVTKALAELREVAGREGIEVQLHPGTEIFYRSELEDKLEKQQIHTLNGTDFVLLEFSPFEGYFYIRNAIDDIFSLGYRPIVAHVERYQCLLEKIERVHELKNMGCGIQVNASSIVGKNGFKVKGFVKKLLRKQVIDYVGTDAHDTDKRRPAMKRCAELLYKKYEHEYVDAVLFGNAQRDLIPGQKKM